MQQESHAYNIIKSQQARKHWQAFAAIRTKDCLETHDQV